MVNITQYDLLISCPGDVISEVSIINDMVNQFNEQYSDVLGISIRPKHWKKHSYPQSGGKPQDLLNEQLVKNCDASVAIFWTRFGSPTDRYDSGTEEEIEIMISSGKQVFMYFSDKPAPPSCHDRCEYKRVCDFKIKYAGTGIYSCYTSDDEFKMQFFAHLSQYFLSKQKLDDQKNRPDLVIKSVHDQKLSDIARIIGFQFNGMMNKEEMVDKIKDLYQAISSIEVSKANSDSNPLFVYTKSPIEILESTKQELLETAKTLNVTLPDDFFILGDLYENRLSASLITGGGRDIYGSSKAKNKYRKIIELKELIDEAIGWLPFAQIFAGVSCLRLAIANDGKALDEDIDVELTIPKDLFKHHTDFPLPEYGAMEYVAEKIVGDSLFAIESTANYKSYLSSIKSESNESPDSTRYIQTRDYKEEYEEALDDSFDYEFYWDDDYVKIKIHFDYVKQHTAVAFPTPLFVSNDIGDIQYTIISRNSPDVIHGVIKVER